MRVSAGHPRTAGPTFIVGLLVVLLAGCATSGIKTFPNSSPSNLRVLAQPEGTVSVRHTGVDVDIYRLLPGCRLEHLGRVELGQATNVGLPTDQPLYIEFLVMTKSVKWGMTSAIRYDTRFMARKGHQYEVEIRYGENTYSVAMRELAKGAFSGRLIERKTISEC